LLAGRPADAAAGVWHVDPARSQLVVYVSRAGALSPALHDHQFFATRWGGTISVDPSQPQRASLRLTVDASSLRDREPGLSPRDVRTVEAQVRGPEVLDAERFPEIRFVASRFEPLQSNATGAAGALRGVVFGTLTLHGTTRPMRIPVQTAWSQRALEARGSVEFLQSEFGIRPYRRALGTIAVRDRVRVAFSVRAVPTAAAP
jgi:polyisoprenoid-binding protein YceI